jgi:hypothetical protein
LHFFARSRCLHFHSQTSVPAPTLSEHLAGKRTRAGRPAATDCVTSGFGDALHEDAWVRENKSEAVAGNLDHDSMRLNRVDPISLFEHDLRANASRLSRGKIGSHFSGSCSSKKPPAVSRRGFF